MCNEKTNKENLLIEIDNKTKAMINLGKQLAAISSDVEPFDMLLISIINRTVNLNSGFTTLVRNNNFIASAPLIRINLDSLLRLYASIISEYDRNTFAIKVMNGIHIRNIKLKNSKISLTDKELKDRLSSEKGMEWVNKIYEAGNSFVHFGDSIFYSSQKKANEEERTILMSIGLHDSFIDESEKFGAIVWMNKIIDSIIIQCQIWFYEKCQKYNYNIEDLNSI
jgi:hypothetical protein